MSHVAACTIRCGARCTHCMRRPALGEFREFRRGEGGGCPTRWPCLVSYAHLVLVLGRRSPLGRAVALLACLLLTPAPSTPVLATGFRHRAGCRKQLLVPRLRAEHGTTSTSVAGIYICWSRSGQRSAGYDLIQTPSQARFCDFLRSRGSLVVYSWEMFAQ